MLTGVVFYTMALTVPEAARRAGRSPETIRRWIWSGKLPAEKVGNQHVIEEAALDALLPTVEPEEDVELVEVPGEWGEWLRRAEGLKDRLRAEGVRLPSGAELVRESRRGR
jgi:excisionase family DNA binding protein